MNIGLRVALNDAMGGCSVRTRGDRWTNPSVLQFAQGGDPVEAVIKRAREVVVEALDAGWSGPPFDPFDLARLLKLEVVARGDVPDARTVPVGRTGLCIEFNPNRPRGRVRYSVAHEIAHTLFEDCRERVRNRAAHDEVSEEDWQLEALCNIAAAELLMPVGSLRLAGLAGVGIDDVLELRNKYDVSTEALLIRVAHVMDVPCAIFCASKAEKPGGSYQIDYAIGTRAWPIKWGRGYPLPAVTAVAECTAIGYTAKADEVWGGTDLHMECVGIPPFPGAKYPRVAGILTPREAVSSSPSGIVYLKGSALEPRGTGEKIIVHIVNDATPRWGGRGFAQAVRRKWPHVQAEFMTWAAEGRRVLSLGRTHFAQAEPGVIIASMVSQHGYGHSLAPRIRYAAMRAGLADLAAEAVRRGASVHMPRIGSGQAGGSWEIIEELVRAALIERGVSVSVYDLPDRALPELMQHSGGAS